MKNNPFSKFEKITGSIAKDIQFSVDDILDDAFKSLIEKYPEGVTQEQINSFIDKALLKEKLEETLNNKNLKKNRLKV